MKLKFINFLILSFLFFTFVNSISNYENVNQAVKDLLEWGKTNEIISGTQQKELLKKWELILPELKFEEIEIQKIEEKEQKNSTSTTSSGNLIFFFKI